MVHSFGYSGWQSLPLPWRKSKDCGSVARHAAGEHPHARPVLRRPLALGGARPPGAGVAGGLVGCAPAVLQGLDQEARLLDDRRPCQVPALIDGRQRQLMLVNVLCPSLARCRQQGRATLLLQHRPALTLHARADPALCAVSLNVSAAQGCTGHSAQYP
jgi:hypothetical protein